MSTPTLDQFQCPRCQLSGDLNLFEPGWPDARYLYNWLSRHES